MPWKDAFRRIEPGEKRPEPPEGLKTWSAQTVYGLLGGMLFGGYQGLLQARDASIPSPTPTRSPQQRAAVFFVRESILTGARIGAFVSIFSAAVLAVEGARGLDDPVNYAAAGAVTCGFFGAGIAGVTAVPATAGFGALVAGGVGLVRSRLQTLQEEAVAAAEADAHAETEDQESSIAFVVRSMEHNLSNHPLRRVEKEDVVDEESA